MASEQELTLEGLLWVANVFAVFMESNVWVVHCKSMAHPSRLTAGKNTSSSLSFKITLL